MLQKTKLLLIASIIFLCQACNPKSTSLIHYSPNEASVLKVIEEKDFKISGSAKNGIENDDDDLYFGVQAGYSPIQSLGISGGYFLLKPSSSGNLFQMGNLSVGGYHLWQPKYIYYKSRTEKNKWKSHKNKHGQFLMPFGVLFEAYGGVELGKAKGGRTRFSGTNAFKTESSQLNLVRYFVKTGIHFQDKIFGLSFMSKIGFMDYYKGVLDIEGGSSTGLDDYFFDGIEFNNGYFFEPTCNFHFGTQTIRGYFGVTVPILFKENNLKRKEKLWSIGIVVDIDNLRRKEEVDLDD